LVALILAILGFFGYQIVIERAEIRADRVAKETVARLHDTGKLAAPGSSASSASASAAVSTKGATKEDAAV
jgi:hypothetical protein